MQSRIVLILAAILSFSASPASAQDYPNRPVTLIVPWPAGGTTDIGMRALASATEKHLKQKIVVENRPGAGGVLGPQQVAHQAAPDGYTLVHRIDLGCGEKRARLDKEHSSDVEMKLTENRQHSVLLAVGGSGQTFPHLLLKHEHESGKELTVFHELEQNR